MATPKSKQSFVKLKIIKARVAECRKTQKLALSGLELTELPEGLVGMIKGAGANVIVEFDFHHNNLSDIIPEIAEFRSLRALRLYQNNFHQLPQVVFSFHKLQVLDVSENELKEMDHLVGSLIALRELNYARNHLASLPQFWKNLGFLLYLNVANNQLAEIPESVGTLKHLQRLDISSNIITALPLGLQNLQELIMLDLHNNQLTHIPPSYSLLKNLQELNCEANPLAEPANKVYARGFEDFMEFLRDSYSQQQLEELIRQKPQAFNLGSYLQFPTRFEAGPGGPSRRSLHSVTAAGPILFMYGGVITNYGKVDDMYNFDLRTLLWAKPGTSGTAPPPRDGHAVGFDGVKRLYIFGGRNEENKLLNDLHYLDVKSLSWYQPLVEGNVPSAREGASLAVVGGQVILFGGRGSRQRHNDMFTLCIQTWTWIPQRTKGAVPGPRERAATAVMGNYLYVHGGKGNVIQDDIHVLDVPGLVWTKVLQRGLCPSPRYNHMATIFNNKLYIVGGTDGTASLTSLFGLSIGADASNQGERSAQAKSWLELDTEVTASSHCMFCFHDNKLIVFRPNQPIDDTVDSTTELWDTYMEAPLEQLKPVVHKYVKEKELETKTERVMGVVPSKMPRSYQVQSQKEQQLLKHVKHFQKRFRQVYPERRPLLLIAKNECCVEKFICTTIKPSHMEYTELYEWQGCCNFIANFLSYDQLEDPRYFPSYIPSPQTVLQWQRGDCFDFSIALSSLLIGARFEAYCVAGYAPKFLTTYNQETSTCPKAVEEQENAARRPPQKPERKTKYSKPSPPILNALYLSKKKEVRDAAAQRFAEKFKECTDTKLRAGQGEEEDNLVRFCVERCNVPDLEEPDTPEPSEGAPSTEGTSQTSQPSSPAPSPPPPSPSPPPPAPSPSPPPPPADGAAQGCLAAVPSSVSGLGFLYSAGDEKRPEPEVDELDRKRVHCWVMIVAGKRGLTESFFVEPSTGRKYPIVGSPYCAVEYVWNHANVWINMQPNPARAGIDELSWNLKDTVKWERLFDGTDTEGRQRDALTLVDPDGALREAVAAAAAKAEASRVATPATPASTDGGTPAAGAGAGAAASSFPVKGADKKVEEPVEKTGETDVHHWLLPPSWVPKLEISMEAFVTRCPQGTKKTHYEKCTHEMYAFYGDYVRWDGLIERLHFYADSDRTVLLECHDYFQRRKDGLKKRIFYIQQNKVHDFFNQGTAFGLKEIEIVEGVSRRFVFYLGSRTDGLITREETLGKRLVETFDNPETPMVYRCACYGLPAPISPPQPAPVYKNEPEPLPEPRKSSSRAGSVKGEVSGRSSRTRISSDSARGKSLSRTMSRFRSVSSRRSRTPVRDKRDAVSERKYTISLAARRKTVADSFLPITKLTIKFSKLQPRNIFKKVFKINLDQIRVDFHHINRRITYTSRLYTKDGTMSLLQVDPFEPELELFARMDEFHELLVTERETIKGIRDAENETRDILQHRLKDEQNVMLNLPYVDVACFKQDETLLDREADMKAPADYLSPFLPPGTRPRQKLSRAQMLDVREHCLKALKQRLLNRANIIQSRYDEETAALAKRRANFERDREQMTVDEVEKYDHECETAVFRIRILEKRAKEHEQQALKKYTDLDKKLRSDPRLASLYDGTAM